MPPTHNATGRVRKNSGDINLAPLATTSRPYPKRRNKIDGQFAARLIEMLESPPYRALSQSAHRVLSRIEIELGHHAGKDNGRLPVTYEDFEAYGIDRHSIAPAIRELEGLGFIEVTEQGRAGHGEFGWPNRFRLTFRPTQTYEPTHEWRRIGSWEKAVAIAKEARKPIRKTKRQCGKIPISVGKFPTENAEIPVGETPTTPPVGDSPPLSIVSGRGPDSGLDARPDDEVRPYEGNQKARRSPLTDQRRKSLLSSTSASVLLQAA